MRRLLASTPVLAAAALLLIAVITWAILSNARHPRTVVHDRPVVTTPIVSSPLTPLQTRRARRTAAGRSPDSKRTATHATGTAGTTRPRQTATKPKHQTAPANKRKNTPKRPAPQSPPSAPPASPSQPPPEPPPSVTVPLPSICIKPIHVGTCP